MRWQAGVDWNSRLRIGSIGSGPEIALYLTSARLFGAPATGPLPPRTLIDGTGDEELKAMLFEMDITRLGAKARSAAEHAPPGRAHGQALWQDEPDRAPRP